MTVLLASDRPPATTRPLCAHPLASSAPVTTLLQAGCMPYFERRLIKHAIVEVTAGYKFWESRGIDALDVAATFERIVRAGYSLTLLLNAVDAKAGNGTKMTDPSAVRDWVLARKMGQVDVMLSLA